MTNSQYSLEEICVSFLNKNSFYITLLSKLAKVETSKIATFGLGVYNEKLTLFYNKDFLKKISLKEAQEEIVNVLHQALFENPLGTALSGTKNKNKKLYTKLIRETIRDLNANGGVNGYSTRSLPYGVYLKINKPRIKRPNLTTEDSLEVADIINGLYKKEVTRLVQENCSEVLSQLTVNLAMTMKEYELGKDIKQIKGVMVSNRAALRNMASFLTKIPGELTCIFLNALGDTFDRKTCVVNDLEFRLKLHKKLRGFQKVILEKEQ